MARRTVQQRAARILQRSDPDRWKYSAALREIQREEEEDPGYAWRMVRAEMRERVQQRDEQG
ncbi:hypothetical protein SAMN02800687_0529 [Curtobacterium sp. UNCCL20]|nr:hypothetical protein SAMN02800687_0529 [Curtobacterium sp. UNCCL20]